MPSLHHGALTYSPTSSSVHWPVNYDRSSKKAEQYREDLKKARPSDAEQGITISKLLLHLRTNHKEDLMISERIVDDSEEIIRMISGKFKQG